MESIASLTFGTPAYLTSSTQKQGNNLYEDPRLSWALERIQPTNLWDVIELGPLKDGHSYYMEKHTSARSITAIEANRLCWEKCLVAKEITDLKRTRFLLGNFIEYLKTTIRQSDLCLALGVLYHIKTLWYSSA